jgi:hypothetical protein
MTKQFYQKALPSQGVYCVAGIKNEKTTHRFVETFDDLVDAIDDFKNEGQNVFVALNSFSGHSRKAEYAQYCKSFFIDLDVGASDKKYPSKDEALAALDDFVSQYDLPPPVRVDSGGGVHAYWIFDRDVPTEEWKIYATKFKQMCLDYLKIDPAVTADAARVLRCPDTFNYKKDPPMPTKLLDSEYFEYDFDMFKSYLGEVNTVASIIDQLPKGLDEDTRKIARFDNYETTFSDIAEKSLSDQGCAQIKHILVNSTTLEEPLWYAGLSIARHCTDWETSIHLMSEDHPEYNYEATIRKANQTTGKPFSCEKFNDLNPSGCAECPMRGRVTNPLAIGRRFVEAEDQPKPEEAAPDAVRISENTQEISAFPPAIRPYVRGRTGGIYYLPPSEIDEDGVKFQPDPILLSTNDFYPTKRMYSRSDGELFSIRVVMPHEVREFDLSHESMQSLDEFKRTLGRAGISPPVQAHWPKLVEYMTKWAHYLQAQDAAEQIRGQMGWTPNYDAFVIGTMEITRSGEERPAPVSPLVKAVASMLEPRGTYEKWTECANKLNMPGFEMHAFAVGMAFGSPLMRFCTTSGMTFCYTGNTGGGKTGALLAACSVFASPKDISVFKSTDNGLVQRALNLKNIALCLDEVKDKDPKELSNLIHSISQGKGKIRLKSNVNAEREQELNAAQMCFMTSNESMRDKIFAAKRNPTGEMARYMEFRVPRPAAMAANAKLGEEIFDPFNTNYGWAGIHYIKYLMKVGDASITKRIEKWHDRIRESRFGTDASYRFYENAISAAFAGLELAGEANIIDYDLNRIFDHVLLQSIMVRDKTVKDGEVDYEALISEFLYKYQRGILVFNEGRQIADAYGAIVARIEVDNGMQYISKTELRKYLVNECNVSTEEMETTLKNKGALVDAKKMRLSSGWKGGVTAPIWVYAFRADPAVTKEFLEKFKNAGDDTSGT